MRTDKGKPLPEKPVVRMGGSGPRRPAAPEPPTLPQAPKQAVSGNGATSVDAAEQVMPDLDQFNFMKW